MIKLRRSSVVIEVFVEIVLVEPGRVDGAYDVRSGTVIQDASLYLKIVRNIFRVNVVLEESAESHKVDIDPNRAAPVV